MTPIRFSLFFPFTTPLHMEGGYPRVEATKEGGPVPTHRPTPASVPEYEIFFFDHEISHPLSLGDPSHTFLRLRRE
ncbi:acetyl-CoA hydrolase [Streptomyces laurentii]|uniref:Acetyl-CoA hydrolase n=1 Tax=Streptomyces laurentii TaxID=39478 RepID=A0A160P9N2_STRLU|nr:acetyl-CoA hydrolase [Streptomyces laurentii]